MADESCTVAGVAVCLRAETALASHLVDDVGHISGIWAGGGGLACYSVLARNENTSIDGAGGGEEEEAEVFGIHLGLGLNSCRWNGSSSIRCEENFGKLNS